MATLARDQIHMAPRALGSMLDVHAQLPMRWFWSGSGRRSERRQRCGVSHRNHGLQRIFDCSSLLPDNMTSNRPKGASVEPASTNGGENGTKINGAACSGPEDNAPTLAGLLRRSDERKRRCEGKEA